MLFVVVVKQPPPAQPFPRRCSHSPSQRAHLERQSCPPRRATRPRGLPSGAATLERRNWFFFVFLFFGGERFFFSSSRRKELLIFFSRRPLFAPVLFETLSLSLLTGNHAQTARQGPKGDRTDSPEKGTARNEGGLFRERLSSALAIVCSKKVFFFRPETLSFVAFSFFVVLVGDSRFFFLSVQTSEGETIFAPVDSCFAGRDKEKEFFECGTDENSSGNPPLPDLGERGREREGGGEREKKEVDPTTNPLEPQQTADKRKTLLFFPYFDAKRCMASGRIRNLLREGDLEAKGERRKEKSGGGKRERERKRKRRGKRFFSSFFFPALHTTRKKKRESPCSLSSSHRHHQQQQICAVFCVRLVSSSSALSPLARVCRERQSAQA